MEMSLYLNLLYNCIKGHILCTDALRRKNCDLPGKLPELFEVTSQFPTSCNYPLSYSHATCYPTTKPAPIIFSSTYQKGFFKFLSFSGIKNLVKLLDELGVA